MISLPGSPIQIEYIVSISEHLVEVIFSYVGIAGRDIKVFAVTEDIWDKISDPASYSPEPADESELTKECSIPLYEPEWLALARWCERYHISTEQWVRAMLQFYIAPENREIARKVIDEGCMRQRGENDSSEEKMQ